MVLLGELVIYPRSQRRGQLSEMEGGRVVERPDRMMGAATGCPPNL